MEICKPLIGVKEAETIVTTLSLELKKLSEDLYQPSCQFQDLYPEDSYRPHRLLGSLSITITWALDFLIGSSEVGMVRGPSDKASPSTGTPSTVSSLVGGISTPPLEKGYSAYCIAPLHLTLQVTARRQKVLSIFH